MVTAEVAAPVVPPPVPAAPVAPEVPLAPEVPAAACSPSPAQGAIDRTAIEAAETACRRGERTRALERC